MTLVEVIVVVVTAIFLAVMVTVILQYMGQQHYGTLCSSNLKGIGTAFYTYANENNDMWPIVPHAVAQDDGVGRVTYAPKMIGVRRAGVAGKPFAPVSVSRPADGGSTGSDTALSTTRNLWLLVRAGMSTPRSFVCPNSDDEVNNEDLVREHFDFRNYSEVSYGFQVPYGKKGQPSSNCDQRMALAADKGPFSAALEAGKKHPGTPNLLPSAGPNAWMPWNSPNHGGEGQVVLYADSHADFQTKPTAGIDGDNIYTRWSGAAGEIKANVAARAQGVPPTGRETPWSDTDSLIYP